MIETDKQPSESSRKGLLKRKYLIGIFSFLIPFLIGGLCGVLWYNFKTRLPLDAEQSAVQDAEFNQSFWVSGFATGFAGLAFYGVFSVSRRRS
jgi:hypothetical protein